MKNNLFYAALATMMLAACSNEEVIDTTLATPVELQVSAGVNSETRTNGKTWESGDKIGISVTSSTKNSGSTMTGYTNVEYDISDGAGTSTASFAASGTKILFSDATESVDFAAYSPYSSNSGTISLSAASDGSVDDYLWASATGKKYTDNPVSFQFNHKMAKLKIVIKLNSDFDGDSNKTIGNATITGLYSTASFDIKTGIVSNQTASGTVTFSNGIFEEIIIPGTPSLTLSVTIGDQTYNVSAFKPTVTQGASYQYTITAGKTGLTVSSCTINAWPSSETGTGTASMTSN